MAETYTLNVAATSRAEVTGGRVGTFTFQAVTGGTYHLGDSGVDNTNGIVVSNSVYHQLYVTSPDEVYLYNESLSAGTVRVFHNR